MDIEIRKAMGAAIAERRNQQNMTQEALASEIGLSPRSVQRIEAGVEQPRYETLFKISSVLNTDPSTFINPMWNCWNAQ